MVFPAPGYPSSEGLFGSLCANRPQPPGRVLRGGGSATIARRSSAGCALDGRSRTLSESSSSSDPRSSGTHRIPFSALLSLETRVMNAIGALACCARGRAWHTHGLTSGLSGVACPGSQRGGITRASICPAGAQESSGAHDRSCRLYGRLRWFTLFPAVRRLSRSSDMLAQARSGKLCSVQEDHRPCTPRSRFMHVMVSLSGQQRRRSNVRLRRGSRARQVRMSLARERPHAAWGVSGRDTP